MRIRLAQPADAPAVADIWNAMIRDSLATFTTVPKTNVEIADLMAVRASAFWVAETDQICGFASFGPFRNGPGYAATVEHTVILCPAAQAQGGGRALMQAVERGARASGAHVMVAGISSANPGAVAFHAALGFTQTGRLPEVGHKGGQWLDLILMQKTVSAS